MTDTPEFRYIPSKDEIKEKLPLWYAIPRLGTALSQQGQGFCPFHNDVNDPSLGLWVTDAGETRWHCFPCGLDGDVFDFIQRLHGCTFPESITFAADLLGEVPEDYVPPVAEIRTKERNVNAIVAQVTAARERAAQPDHAGILAARVGYADVSNPALCAKWDSYLRNTWGWGISFLGEVLMPHWSATGELTGSKVRIASGSRISITDSVYPNLYGAWLGRKNHDVLLTEGETDCAFAGWLAREEGIGIDVFAMPSGAGDDIDPNWVEFVRRVKTIYLAFDPDTAGIKCTWNWVKALQSEGLRNFKICCLPLGKDLRDAQPTLRHLLDSARTMVPQPVDIECDAEGYSRYSRDGETLRRITNWSVEPIAQLVGGAPGYDVLLSYRGAAHRTVLELSDLASARDIKKWCNKHGLIFTAKEDDLQRIAEHVIWRGSVTPEIYQTDQVGMQEAPKNYEFAGPSVVLPTGYFGKMPWRYIPSTRVSNVSDKVFLPTEGTFSWRWLEDFLKLSSPSVTHPLLSWAIASTRRPEVVQFPIMFIGGSSGVGKSTLARLAMRLVGSGIEIDLGAVTPFILLRTLASSTSLPVFIDEWTLMSRKDARETFQGTIPVLYTGGSAERGQADLSSTEYKLLAPVIVAGEDTFTLDRELDRTVAISPTRDTQDRDALARITGVPLERFGQRLHTWLTTQHNLPALAGSAPTRPEYNKQILENGWRTLYAFLEDASHSDPTVPTIPELPDLSALDAERDEQNVYETALLEGLSMRDANGHSVVWNDPENKGTWVRIRVLIGILRTRNVDLMLPGGERAMKRYFEERYGAVSSERVTPPGEFTAVHAALIPGLQMAGESDPRESWQPS